MLSFHRVFPKLRTAPQNSGEKGYIYIGLKLRQRIRENQWRIGEIGVGIRVFKFKIVLPTPWESSTSPNHSDRFESTAVRYTTFFIPHNERGTNR